MPRKRPWQKYCVAVVTRLKLALTFTCASTATSFSRALRSRWVVESKCESRAFSTSLAKGRVRATISGAGRRASLFRKCISERRVLHPHPNSKEAPVIGRSRVLALLCCGAALRHAPPMVDHFHGAPNSAIFAGNIQSGGCRFFLFPHRKKNAR